MGTSRIYPTRLFGTRCCVYNQIRTCRHRLQAGIKNPLGRLNFMKKCRSQFPDITSILAQKAAGRRERAALSFAEKLIIMDEMKERVAPIVHARELRKRQRRQLVKAKA